MYFFKLIIGTINSRIPKLLKFILFICYDLLLYYSLSLKNYNEGYLSILPA